jgi:hypothetical protein
MLGTSNSDSGSIRRVWDQLETLQLRRDTLSHKVQQLDLFAVLRGEQFWVANKSQRCEPLQGSECDKGQRSAR